MPKDALADILYDWEHLLAALDQFLERHPEASLRRKRDEIAAILAYAKLLAAEQDDLAARRQVITKELRIAKGRGKDAAIQARALLKGHLGHRSVALTRFRIRPVRRRSRALPETSDVAALTSALGAERAKLALSPMEIAGLPLALPEAPIAGPESPVLLLESPASPAEAPAGGGEDSVPPAEAPRHTAEAPVTLAGVSAEVETLPADS